MPSPSSLPTAPLDMATLCRTSLCTLSHTACRCRHSSAQTVSQTPHVSPHTHGLPRQSVLLEGDSSGPRVEAPSLGRVSRWPRSDRRQSPELRGRPAQSPSVY